MKKILLGAAALVIVTATLTAVDTTLYEVNFNDAFKTSLDNVTVDTGASFSATNFDYDLATRPNNGTDDAGNYDFDLVASNGSSAFASFGGASVNLGTGGAGVGVAAGTYITQTAVFTGIDINATTNNLTFGIGLYDGSQAAQLYLRTSNSGTRIRVAGSGNGESGHNDASTGIAGNTTTGITALEMRWIVDVAANTYVASYRETIGSGAWTESAVGTFGYDTGNFNEIDRMRIFTNGEFGAGSSVSLDSVKVVLTTVPEPGTYALLSGLCALGFVMVRRRG